LRVWASCGNIANEASPQTDKPDWVIRNEWSGVGQVANLSYSFHEPGTGCFAPLNKTGKILTRYNGIKNEAEESLFRLTKLHPATPIHAGL